MSENFKKKQTAAAPRGFLAIAWLSCSSLARKAIHIHSSFRSRSRK